MTRGQMHKQVDRQEDGSHAWDLEQTARTGVVTSK